MCLFIFLGNKNDKSQQREIPIPVGEEFSRRHSMKFIETSAKAADNVDELFLDIAKQLTKQARENDLKPGLSDSQELGQSSPISSWTSCCKMQ